MASRPQRQQAPQDKVSTYDLNRAQSNITKTITDLQQSTLQFISNEPKTSSSPGTPLQAWLGPNGELKICYAKNSWVKFVGITFP